MHIIRDKQLLALILTAVAFVPAAADEYKDSSGFSFEYPEGWVAVGKPGKALSGAKLAPEIQAWLKLNQASLNKVTVVVLREKGGEFLENMNVVLERQRITVNDATVKKLVEVMPRQFRAAGATLEDMEGRVQKLGNNKAMVLDYRLKLPGAKFFMKQKQVFFSGGGTTCIVTCSAPAETFATYAPTFDKILAGFKLPGE
jgi:hypothetical protein